MAQELTFEQIDAHIKSADLTKYQASGAQHFTAEDVKTNATGVLQSFCGIYHVVRPILVVISNFPLIPAAWRAAVTTFIGLGDSICPGS